MIEVKGEERLLSSVAVKRFSKPRHFGTSQFAYSQFGAEDIFLEINEFGNTTFGVGRYGNIFLLSGVYQRFKIADELKIFRYPFNLPKNPRTEDQQNWRQVFQEGAEQWQLLSDEQKKIWNEKAIGKNLYGYNLFLSDYLK